MALTLLAGLTPRQRVNVVTSASLAYDMHGMKQSGRPQILGCKESLAPATPLVRRRLSAAVRGLSAQGGSEHFEGLRTAFRLLERGAPGRVEATETEGVGGSCRQTLIFISDGVYEV